MSDSSINDSTSNLLNGPLMPKLYLVAGILALTAIIALATNNLREEKFSVLFANLSDRDGGAIIADLNKRNIAYKFAAGGNAIMVPAADVHRVRLRLASEGLPRGGNVGFELMDKQSFGVTQFQEKLNYQRGLQGELSRSIESLAAVESARVHLSIPDRNGFLRSQNRPTASVLVRLYPGQYLDRNQSAGIVHLVAASLGKLSPDDVTLIDQNGSLLVNRDRNSMNPDPSQVAYLENIEKRLSQRIIDLLEPVVGRGNVRARVTADVDFTATQSTDETFKPNQGGQQATIRSQQIKADGGSGNPEVAQGIPGALSNQPQPNGALAAAANANPPQGNAESSGSKESVVNYEVDKSVRVTKNGVGNIQRLTAAVVINHRKVVDDAGKVSRVALTPEEINNMNALVRQAIGFTQNRGDEINIMNSAFVEEAVVEVPDVPLWKDPQVTSLVVDLFKHLGIVLLGFFTIFKVIKPALTSMTSPPAVSGPPVSGGVEGARLNTVVENDLQLPRPDVAKEQIASATNEAQELVNQSPAAVATVVREWVAEG